LLVGAAGAGALIWFAGRFDEPTLHDYWISLGLIVAAGLVLGVTRRVAVRAASGVALVALFVTFWVALAVQPTGGHVARWSQDIGIGGVVHDLGIHVSVLAFGAAMIAASAVRVVRWRRASLPAAAPEPTLALVMEPGMEPLSMEPDPAQRERMGAEPTLGAAP
jgi:hypothetical protein